MWRKILFAVGVMFLAGMLLLFGNFIVYEPVKFAVLATRVKQARTAEDERAAFLMAHKWGNVWEIRVTEGGNLWGDFKQLDAAVRDSNRVLQIEIEWLECRPWNGKPYRATRTLTEKTNLRVLLENFPKQK